MLDEVEVEVTHSPSKAKVSAIAVVEDVTNGSAEILGLEEPSSRSSAGGESVTEKIPKIVPAKKRVLLRLPSGHDDQHQLELAIQRKLRRRQRVHRSISSESSGDDNDTLGLPNDQDSPNQDTITAVATCTAHARETLTCVDMLKCVLQQNSVCDSQETELTALRETLSELSLQATKKYQKRKEDLPERNETRRPSWKQQLVDPNVFAARQLQLDLLLTRCPSWDIALRTSAASNVDSPRRQQKEYRDLSRVREEELAEPLSPLRPLSPPPPILPSDIHDGYSSASSSAVKPTRLYSSRQRAQFRRSRTHGLSPPSSFLDDDTHTIQSFSTASYSDYDDRLRDLEDDAFAINIPDEPSIRSTSTTPRNTLPFTPRTSEDGSTTEIEQAAAAAAALAVANDNHDQ